MDCINREKQDNKDQMDELGEFDLNSLLLNHYKSIKSLSEKSLEKISNIKD
jgi:hypothetical protein